MGKFKELDILDKELTLALHRITLLEIRMDKVVGQVQQLDTDMENVINETIIEQGHKMLGK